MRKMGRYGGGCRRAFHFTTHDADETWTEAICAGKILVAGGLVDLPLAPERGVEWDDREAVGFLVAVTTTFAN